MKAGDTILLHAAAGGVGLIAVAMGQAARPARHRHRLHRGKGRAGDGAWLRRDHLLPPRGRADAGQGADRRRRRHDRVRHGRQGHVRRLAEVAEAARRAGRLRHRLRALPADRRAAAGDPGLGLFHRGRRWPTISPIRPSAPSLSGALFDHVAERPHQDRDQPALRAGRRGRRPIATLKQGRRRARRSS